MKTPIFLAACFGLIFNGLTNDVAISEAQLSLFKALPTEAPNPANPQSEAKVDLGRMLYYENRLSKNQQISCNKRTKATCNR